MADSLTKIGSFDMLDIDANWAESISAEYLLSRKLLSYVGGVSTFEAMAPECPVALDVSFLCASKQEEHELLTFFVSRKGRLQRFWFKHPAAAFSLLQPALAGASGLYCSRNYFELVYQGYERIYIMMNSGDLVARKITSCTSGTYHTYIGFDTALDRDITLDNHVRIGRLLLGRFDSDLAKFKFASAVVSTMPVKFTELVKEYSLAD
jgi:hypothetical protein